jgi:predicted nucleic acid-binding protein
MKHVFVETNWVVEFGAPAQLRHPEALALAQQAQHEEIRFYVPTVCLTEARQVFRSKYQPRNQANSVRSYLNWAMANNTQTDTDCKTVHRILDQYEAAVSADLQQPERWMAALRTNPGVEVFPLNDAMLTRAVELSTQNLDLKPFDQAILAAILVRGEELRDGGAGDVCFCELDRDLQPWNREGATKEPLKSLYNAAQIWVYGDFAMESPLRRSTFPEQ